MARNYACLKHEYLEEMELLTDAEFGRLCRALLAYSAEGKEGQLQGSERLFWPRVKRQEDKAVENYTAMVEQRSAAGQKSAATRANNRQRSLTPVNESEQPSTGTGKYKSESEKECKSESYTNPSTGNTPTVTTGRGG